MYLLTAKICYISNTRDSVSSGYPNTEKRVEIVTLSGVFLTKFEVWIADETVSSVFDISFRTKQKLFKEHVNGEVKSMLSKTGYPNLLH